MRVDIILGTIIQVDPKVVNDRASIFLCRSRVYTCFVLQQVSSVIVLEVVYTTVM